MRICMCRSWRKAYRRRSSIRLRSRCAEAQEATSKANLIHLAEQEESIRLSFAKVKDGVPVPYSLQTIRTRESDHHHLVIGVRQEDDGRDGNTE